MKIAFTALSLPEGKVKYHDKILADLEEMFKPDKVSPFYFELLPDDYEAAEGIAIAAGHILDVLILDIDKIEGRLPVTEDAAEKSVLEKCLAQLEEEKPVCDLELDAAEREIVNAFGLLSYKPTMVFEEESMTTDAVFESVMEKAEVMFFYTAGKKEVRSWFAEKNANAVSCAGKIHTDLARGFIKAEIVPHEDLMKAHNFKDAASQGLTKLVDADFSIPEKTVLEIRFNV